MDSLDELAKSKTGVSGFLSHVFNFDDSSKGTMLNVIQYALTATIPIIILNKCMQKYIPEADEDKGNVELVAEVVVQIIIMFIGMFTIDRMVTYFPTYSGSDYSEFHITSIVLPSLMILLSLQTKLGDKVSILFERACELWDGEKKPDPKQQKKSTAQGAPQQTTQSAPGTTAISQIPSMQQPSPDFNAMYKQEPTPLVDAAMPTDDVGPVAANSGGGGFGSAFGGGW